MKKLSRYAVALLWHWSIPFVLGGVFAYVVMAWQFSVLAPDIERAFEAAIGSYCGVKQ
jgi:uncharacterized membrane protein